MHRLGGAITRASPITRQFVCYALVLLGAVCQGAFAQSEIKVLSSRADAASGGDAVIQVRVPPGVSALDVTVLRNGVDVSSSFVATDVITLQGFVSGLDDGTNVLLAKTRSTGKVLSRALVQNWPIYGPIFAGPHQRPWICETQASGLGPPPETGPCVGPTRYDWFYRTTAGAFVPLPSLTPPFPANLAQTTTTDGNTVNYIVRVESGVINESIYRIAIIDDPTNPITNPWSPGGKEPGPGWNGKLNYQYVGGAGPGFRSGSNNVTSALDNRPLSRGFAVAFGTRNTFGTGMDDVISAETTMMIKERFIEQYGLPKFTIGTGPSGGSMQQHYIAQNYPGLLDAITPERSFPDLASVAIDVLDCQVLINYFNQYNPPNWPGSRRALIDGYALGVVNGQSGQTACIGDAWSNYANRWQNPVANFSSVVPVALRYDPATNPTGARATYWDANVNSFGRDVNGFARSPYDNIGVQYGLKALNAGKITIAEFLDLNEKIGGLDIDGNSTPSRSVADNIALRNAYQSGRVVSGENLTLPILDTRSYFETPNQGANIHTRVRTFMFLDRLQRATGSIANQVNWMTLGTSTPDVLTMALLGLNEWLENILADQSSDPYATKVIRNKPAYMKDACWFNGVKIEEPYTLDPASQCNQLMPVYGTPRLAAGGSLGGDILKCHLKPVTVTDYAVSFTPAELARLYAIFPQGVCDWTKPGILQQPMRDSWLRFMPVAGTYTRMGRSSFGND